MRYLETDLDHSITNKLDVIIENKWHYTEEMWNAFDEDEKEQVYSEFALAPSEYFEERLKRIGFQDMDLVIDAACSRGRWALSLAKLNRHVKGVDFSNYRIQLCKTLAKSHSLSNVKFTTGDLENLPYEDNSADGIFCYSAIMFTTRPQNSIIS